MLEELFKKLDLVTPVTPVLPKVLPPQVTDGAEVTPVTPVTPEKTKVEAKNSNVIITCFTCRHFQSFNKHGRGAGSCAAHASANGVCHWHDHRHQCRKYEGKP
jgi:hypothetical protein